MTELVKIKKYEVNWPGWPLSVNHFGDEFDEPARIRMIAGGKRIIPFLVKYSKRLGDSILEIGPFFNPIVLDSEIQRRITGKRKVIFLENDPHAISWLKATHNADVMVLDMNTASFISDFRTQISMEMGGHEAVISSVLISQVLNYIDFRMLLAQINAMMRHGGLLFINNVINYGIPPLFSAKRPADNEDLLQGALENGFSLVEKAVLPKYFQKEINDRMILVLEKK